MAESALFMIVVVVAVGVYGIVGYLAYSYRRQANAYYHQLLEARRDFQQLDSSAVVVEQLRQELAAASETARVKGEQARELAEQVQRAKGDMDRRPELTRQAYRIVTLGIANTGKTSLSLKWANPLVQLESIKLKGSTLDRFERTVSVRHMKETGVAVQHVFEVNDWGGEYIPDTYAMLVREAIHGMLFVVDLAEAEKATAVEPARVKRQLEEFPRPTLRLFFSANVTDHCKTVVLFINKADLISGTPAEVEAKAKAYYKPLIDELQAFQEAGTMDLKVVVGSATSGHNVHDLFAHFVRNILPANAYDEQLIQGQTGAAFETLGGPTGRGQTPRPR